MKNYLPKLEKFILKEKPKLIIHLAGNTSHSKSFENPIRDIDSNTKTTLFMLEKIKDDITFTNITGSGNLEIAGNISGSATSTGSFGHIITTCLLYTSPSPRD